MTNNKPYIFDQESESLSDPLGVARGLIKIPSITPEDSGAIKYLAGNLNKLGFECQFLPFGNQDKNNHDHRIENLYALLSTDENKDAPVLCFAGHTDVVPPGDFNKWSQAPFDASIIDGKLYGRGASDMKGAIAAWIAACARILSKGPLKYSIALMITGDEEGAAINGTLKIVKWLKQNKKRIDHCIVGEPTNPIKVGDMIKIGRRGSVNFKLTLYGVSGHVAYPQLALNPMPNFFEIGKRLSLLKLDEGDNNFPPSNLEITSIKTDNRSTNVIPENATICFNVRFNTKHDKASLERIIRKECELLGINYSLESIVSAEPFITKTGEFTNLFSKVVKSITGNTPEFSTTGGTSDARFIKNICPVLEFGAVNKTAHKIDEYINLKDLELLTKVYEMFIQKYQDIA